MQNTFSFNHTLFCRFYSSRVRLYRTELAFSALHERGLPLELVEQFALHTQLFLIESYRGILLFFKNNLCGRFYVRLTPLNY